jgi:hypothetical protein
MPKNLYWMCTSEREHACRRNMPETEGWGTGSPFNHRSVSPRPLNGERAGHGGQAIGAVRRVIDCRQRIGARLQGDDIGFAVRIGCINGGNQAGHIARCTRKVDCVARVCYAHQAHQDHGTGDTPPPAQPPFDHASMGFEYLGLVLQWLRLLFQSFDPLMNVVHALHGIPLLWFVLLDSFLDCTVA